MAVAILNDAVARALVSAFGLPYTSEHDIDDNSFGRPTPYQKIEPWEISEAHTINVWGDFGVVDFEVSSIGIFERVRFRIIEVTTQWPSANAASDVTSIEASSPRNAGLRSRGGRPPIHNWDAFWIEVIIWAAANDLKPDDRPTLRRQMLNWFAEFSPAPPNSSSIDRKLALLFNELTRRTPQNR